MLEGLILSIGTVGDALDDALCKTTIGPYKTECVREGSPFRSGPINSLSDLENMTSKWVAECNASRLMHRLGRRPPADVTIARIAIPPTATGPVMLDCREPRPVKPQTFEARVQDVEASGRLGGSQ